MSAADKLRALDDLSTYPSGVIARSDAAHVRGRLLLDVLPALIAVVEAAEEELRLDECGATVAALAALDAALGGEE